MVIDHLKQVRGSRAAIAKRLGITRSAVYQWTDVPVEHVAVVSEITGLSPAEIRPDLARVFGATSSHEAVNDTANEVSG